VSLETVELLRPVNVWIRSRVTDQSEIIHKRKAMRETGLDSLRKQAFTPQNPDESVWDRCRCIEARDGSYVDFVKYFSNRSCDSFTPSSVKTTDFAFVAGSEM
jgi:hypothetical protein